MTKTKKNTTAKPAAKNTTAKPAVKAGKNTTAKPAVKTGKSKKAGTPIAAPVTPHVRQTNKSIAVDMLQKGTTLPVLMGTFNWQAHTTRGFISILGKTHVIESKAVDGVRHYRITGTR
jgi:hypothetical protein